MTRQLMRFYSRAELIGTTEGWRETMPPIHQETAERLQSVEGLACRAGCAHCCKLQVTVLPHEVMDVVDYVRFGDRFTREQRAQVLGRLQNAVALGQGLDAHQYRAADIVCPFLDDESHCMVYSARPMSCRAFGSVNVHICDLSEPDDEKSTFRIIPDAWVGLLYTSGLYFVPFLQSCLDWWQGQGIKAPVTEEELAQTEHVQERLDATSPALPQRRVVVEEPPFRKQGLNGHDHGV